MGLKESGLRGSLRSTSSVLPAFFDVTITNTNSPVQEGDILTVDYSADNTGDAQDTQDIRLEIDSVEEDRDSDITLLGAQSTTGTLQWDTTDESADTYSATVLSDDDSDSVTVEIVSAIPDSGLEHDYNVLNIDADNNDTITSVTDEVGNNDLSGSATYEEDALNGNPLLDHNGSSDELRGDAWQQSDDQEFSAHIVVLVEAQDDEEVVWDQGGSSGGFQFSTTTRLAPSGVTGGPDLGDFTNGELYVMSIRREDTSGDNTNALQNGSETDNDVANADPPGNEAGIGSRGGEWYGNMKWGRFLWYDKYQTNEEFQDTHEALRSEWGT